MIEWQSGRLRFTEVWFEEAVPSSGADIVYARQYCEPLAGRSSVRKATLELNLTSDTSELFAKLKRDTRNEVRRAERDGVCYQSVPETDLSTVLAEFVSFFNDFARSKGLAPLDTAYLYACVEASALDLSRVSSPTGETLAWHAHLLLGQRARLYASASHFRDEKDPSVRNAVGRANRFAHWRDIVRFQEKGYKVYDFGGWYEGNTDKQLMAINRFKAEFGGEVVQRYDTTFALTARGRLYLALRSSATRLVRSESLKQFLRRTMHVLQGQKRK